MGGGEFNYHMAHPNETIKVNLGELIPYLDDHVMSMRDPFVEDFIWSMDDSRHTESTSRELSEIDVPRLMLFADKEVISTSQSSTSATWQGRRFSTKPNQGKDVAPHHEPDIAHHDAR